MQKNNLSIIGILGLAIVVLLVTSGDALAGSPWKWIFDLKSAIKEKPMVMTSSVYVDKARERYYVADAKSLHSFDKSGKYLNSLNPGNQLLLPFDLVRDDTGIFWVVEKGRNSLTRIDLKNKKIEKNILKKADGSVIHPDRISPADNGGFYVLDKASGDLILFSSALKASTVFACRNCGRGFDDFVVKSGKIFALESGERAVYRFAKDGSSLGKVELAGDLSFPFALEVGPTGLLYILDRHKGNIAVFDSSGRFKYSFLAKGHRLKKLYYPEDLFFDLWGRLCVVDAGNGRVEVFSR